MIPKPARDYYLGTALQKALKTLLFGYLGTQGLRFMSYNYQTERSWDPTSPKGSM